MADPFPFELVSPERLLLSEPVLSVVVPGTEGEFTVLKDHAPFMSTIKPGLITVTLAGGSAQQFFVRGGFADVNASGLTILAEHATTADGMSAEALAAEIRAAEESQAAVRTIASPAPAAAKPADRL